jgi:hypothetical protein
MEGIMKILFAAVCGAALCACFAAGLKLYQDRRFESDVKRLFLPDPAVKIRQIARPKTGALPEPVARYLNFAVKDGTAPAYSAKILHSGRFKTSLDGGWSDIRGEEYFLCRKPGFLWRGFLTGASAVDRYVNGRGSLSIYLFSMVRIMEGKGPAYDQGELLRWLGEALWFPTALYPGQNLEWKSAGQNSAELVYRDGNLSVSYLVFFEADGRVSRIETMRYMNGSRLEKWVGYCSDWRETSGMMIPFRIQGGWVIGGKEMLYADFVLDRIDYDMGDHFSTQVFR